MSEYAEKELRLMDEVNEVEVRNHPDKTVIIASLYATWDEDEAETVKKRAKTLGYYGGSPTSLHGSYALKFTKRERSYDTVL